MSVAKIRRALEAQLNGMAPAIALAWENAPYTPVAGTPYARIFLLPTEPENPTFGAGDTFRRERGLFQISLFYPLQVGPADAAARAELIRTSFPRGASFTSGGVTVIIERTPEVAPALYEPDRYVLPVRIRYFANIN